MNKKTDTTLNEAYGNSSNCKRVKIQNDFLIKCTYVRIRPNEN